MKTGMERSDGSIDIDIDIETMRMMIRIDQVTDIIIEVETMNAGTDHAVRIQDDAENQMETDIQGTCESKALTDIMDGIGIDDEMNGKAVLDETMGIETSEKMALEEVTDSDETMISETTLQYLETKDEGDPITARNDGSNILFV